MDAAKLAELSSLLNVPVNSIAATSPGWADAADLAELRASGSGWKEDRPTGAFAFPERDGGGRLVGFSLRANDGRKGAGAAAAGCRRGLIVPTNLRGPAPDSSPLGGPNGEDDDAAVGTARPFLIVEGASDVAACDAMGLRAVGRPSNAAGAEDLARLLDGETFIVVGENDAKETGAWPGRDGAKGVASRLAASMRQPTLWSLPPLPAKDARDFLIRAGGAAISSDAAADAGSRFVQAIIAGAKKAKAATVTDADRVVILATERYRLGRTPEGDAFAVEHEGANVAIMFRGGRDALRSTLSRAFRLRHGRTPGAQALADAIVNLEGIAAENDAEAVALRVARVPAGEADAGAIVVDIGDAAGTAIVVKAEGWRVETRSPVLFRRTDGLTLPLPLPEPGTDVATGSAALRGLLNVTDATFPLVVAFLVAALLPEIGHPITLVTGLHGTGKTSAASYLVRLVDDSAAPVRGEPRDPEAWAVAACGSWTIVLDNVSRIAPWFSDALCKCVTGDGMIRRKLYTGSSVSVLSFRRVAMMTSIDPGSLRGDLADRLLMIDLEPIPDSSRRSELEMEAAFAASRPKILAALLSLLSGVLRELPNVKLSTMPRMADFARVLAAMDRAAPGVTGGRALSAYLAQSGRIAADVVEGDAFAAAVARLADRDGDGWTGTATQLLATIQAPTPTPREWPRGPAAASGLLKRLMPALAKTGVAVRFDPRTALGRSLTISRVDASAQQQHPPPPPPPPLNEGIDDHDDGDARDISGGRADADGMFADRDVQPGTDWATH